MSEHTGSATAEDAASGKAVVVFGESDPNRVIAEELTLDGFDVRRAHNREFLRACCRSGDVDLVIFARGSDAALLGVLRELRAGALDPDVNPEIKVLWIARGERETEVLRAFDAGSDDVIRSPLHYRELVARIAALARRGVSAERHGEVVRHGDLVIDEAKRTVEVASRPVVLRRLEFELLWCLASDPARVFTKAELLKQVWGFRSTGETRTVDSHASRIRSKLAVAGGKGWVVNVRGVGYALDVGEGRSQPAVAVGG